TSMLNHEQHVEQPEGDCRYREKVRRCEDFPVVIHKGLPRYPWRPAGSARVYISRYRSLGDPEAQLQEFAMDARCSPLIFTDHATDEVTQLGVGARSPRLPGDVSPEARNACLCQAIT